MEDSVVVPVYDERLTLPEILTRIQTAAIPKEDPDRRRRLDRNLGAVLIAAAVLRACEKIVWRGIFGMAPLSVFNDLRGAHHHVGRLIHKL